MGLLATTVGRTFFGRRFLYFRKLSRFFSDSPILEVWPDHSMTGAELKNFCFSYIFFSMYTGGVTVLRSFVRP